MPEVMPLGEGVARRSGEGVEETVRPGEGGALAAMATSAAAGANTLMKNEYVQMLPPGMRGRATTRQLTAELVFLVSEVARLRRALAERPVPGTTAAIGAAVSTMANMDDRERMAAVTFGLPLEVQVAIF